MNQVIWIIGALSSSGRKLAKHYSSAGAKLVLIDENRDDLYVLKQDNKGNPMHSHVLSGSLSNPEALKNMVEQALRIFNRVDKLYWITADSEEGITSLQDQPGSEMDRNFWSFVSLHQLFKAPESLHKPKQLIVWSDAAAMLTKEGKELENASKHALRAYVNSLGSRLTDDPKISFVVSQPDFDIQKLEKFLNKGSKEILFPGSITFRLRLLRKLASRFNKALQEFIR